MSRVLIVDDESSVLRVLTRLCERLGCDVSAFANAESAIEALSGSESFDLIMTDIVLPGISGLEFLDWVQKAGYHNRVVVMTAYPNHDFVAYALSHGAIDIVIKPFNDLALLGQRIEGWLQNNAFRQPAAQPPTSMA